MKRLQTDFIDLYQSHHDDPDTPIEEPLEAYSLLVKQGKVRVIGASNFTAERLAQSLAAGREHSFPLYQCLQPCYNLFDRVDFEKNLSPFCLKENLGVIPYYSLAAGFLSGKYRSEADVSKSPRGKSIQKKYMNDRGFRILKALDEVAQDHHSKPTTVALACLMAQPASPLPSPAPPAWNN